MHQFFTKEQLGVDLDSSIYTGFINMRKNKGRVDLLGSVVVEEVDEC